MVVEIPEDDMTEMAECPTCEAEITLDAAFCPSCGQEFEVDDEAEFVEEVMEEEFELEEDYLPEADAPAVAVVAAPRTPVEEPVDSMEDVLADEEKPYKMFWIGVILILLGFFGGPVFSYLHDALEIPVGPFTAYENFGWVNWTVAIIGSIMTGIGVVLLVLGWFRIKKWRDRLEALMEEPEETVELVD